MNLAADLERYGPETCHTAPSLDEARRYCRRLAQSHYENFTVISRLFPRRLHQPLADVYAYCRWADDLADEVAAPLPLGEGGSRSEPGEGSCDCETIFTPALSQREREALRLLDWWQRQLDAVYESGEATHPVFVALAETIKRFDLPRQPLADLLVAFRRDQTQTRYETLDELLTYCEKSANPVGRVVLALGRSLDDENVRLSDSICTALQLANFCQDVRRDHERGRIYLPQEACRRYGWEEAKFAAGQCDGAFRELLRSVVFQAETMLMQGEPLIRRVSRELKAPVRVFVAGGFAILAAIRRCRYDVWSQRPTVGRLTKLRLVASAWWSG